MKHKEIKSIIKKRFEKLNLAFDHVKLHYSLDGIRVFRVKVKKLQACLNLVHAEKSNDQQTRLPKKITKFYEAVGKIRNFKLQQQCINKTLQYNQYDLPEAYLNWLNSHTVHLIEIAVKQTTGKKPFEKSEQQVLTALPDHVSKKTIRDFTKSKINTLEKLLGHVFPDDESFHAARKVLKGLLYTWPYLENNVGLISPYSALSTEQSIESFTVLLGDFHDNSSALQLLNAYCFNDNLSKNERVILCDVEKIWRKENTLAREKNNSSLQKIISSKQSHPSGDNNSY